MKDKKVVAKVAVCNSAGVMYQIGFTSDTKAMKEARGMRNDHLINVFLSNGDIMSRQVLGERFKKF